MVPDATYELVRRAVDGSLNSQHHLCSSTPKIVLDTHVVLECLFWKDDCARGLLEAVESECIAAISSEEALLELAGVASRPHFGWSESFVCGSLSRWCERVKIVPSAEICAAQTELDRLGVRCRDPEDQKFLSLAFAGRASAIITRDRLLLKAAKRLKPFGIQAYPTNRFTLTNFTV